MKPILTNRQEQIKQTAKEFTAKYIAPNSSRYDEEEKIDPDIIKKLGKNKFLGGILPESVGGSGLDMISFSSINEEIGYGCSSIRSLITVHSMCAFAILKWGSEQQKNNWLPGLANGEKIGCFALSEPDVGSDGGSIKTTITEEGNHYVINGHKKWITFGQIADLFLVIGKLYDKLVAVIVEHESPGLKTSPIKGLLGVRASMLADVYFENCRIPKENTLASVGFGFSAVALSALNIGRLSVAAGGVGIAQACLDSSLSYARKRYQFDTLLSDFQLIRRMLANMVTKIKAARLLVYNAAYLLETNSQESVSEIMIAKYFASTTANDIARDAVQILGANGCTRGFPVERLYRDAKITEIIEGSNEINQLFIGKCDFLQ